LEQEPVKFLPRVTSNHDHLAYTLKYYDYMPEALAVGLYILRDLWSKNTYIFFPRTVFILLILVPGNKDSHMYSCINRLA
jgi:hypothetical protein